MLPKALLFDLDDTLISFEHGLDLGRCWLEACEEHLGEACPLEIPTLVAAIQRQARWHWSDADRHRIGRLNLSKARTEIISEALRQVNITVQTGTAMQIALSYGKLRDEMVALLPDAAETLILARNMGIQLAMITNGASEPQRAKIDRFQLAPYVDHIIIEGEYGIGKPDTSVYQHALDLLKVRAEDTWMVGDNYEWEIAAPAQLGIRGVWINPLGKAPSTIEPYLTLRAVGELKAELLRRSK